MSDYTRDQNFSRAQARYDAQEAPGFYDDDDEREADKCGHCDNEARGEWSEDGEDEDGFQPGTFNVFEECAACGNGLCKECADGDKEPPCPKLGRFPYPFEREGVTLEAWRTNHTNHWKRCAERGWCSKEHAALMIKDIWENYGPDTRIRHDKH